MSTWDRLAVELRDVELTDNEFRGLRVALRNIFRQTPPNARLEVPGVSKAGKAYLLIIPTDAEGKPTKIEVDLSPDLSAPVFDAYTDFRNRIAAEKDEESSR